MHVFKEPATRNVSAWDSNSNTFECESDLAGKSDCVTLTLYCAV